MHYDERSSDGDRSFHQPSALHCDMASQSNAAAHPSETVHRTLRHRLYPGNVETGLRLAGMAGACRYVWNHLLADCERRYALWKDYKIGPKPSVSFFTLGKRFTVLRNDPEHAWLKAYPAAVVRYTLKYLADAYKHFLADPVNEGKPRFKARHFTTPGFTIPENVDIRDGRLRVPMIGWLRLSDANLYAGCQPLTVRVRMEGTVQRPKWYAYICYEVPTARVKRGAAEGAVGVDRNVGQATDSEGKVHRMTDTSNLDANIKRKQRKFNRQQKGSNRRRHTGGQLRKLYRKRRRTRDNDTHQASRKLANKAHTVVVEDLNTKGMTQSAKGTVESPGKNVKAKAGLNRAILASGWGGLERKLAYKAGALLKVDPAYTSQTCAVCGHVHQDNRPSQAVFACKACGHRAHADHNAAVNILARAGLPSRARSARGNGAAARRGAFPSGTPTTREPGGGAQGS